jgi:hypothetical protein
MDAVRPVGSITAEVRRVGKRPKGTDPNDKGNFRWGAS